MLRFLLRNEKKWNVTYLLLKQRFSIYLIRKSIIAYPESQRLKQLQWMQISGYLTYLKKETLSVKI